jgi:hypothetical protein
MAANSQVTILARFTRYLSLRQMRYSGQENEVLPNKAQDEN